MVCFSVTDGIHVPRSLHRALILAEEVLRSDLYLSEFIFAVPDATRDSIVKCLDEGGIKIDTIRSWSEMKYYAVAGADAHLGLIRINPILLNEMFIREHRAGQTAVDVKASARVGDSEPITKKLKVLPLEYTEVYAKHMYFLMVKTVRECSNILRWHCSPTSDAKNIKRSSRKVKLVQKITPKVINGNTFDDLGNLLEYTVFGGITEHSEHIHYNAFGIDELLVLPFAKDPNPKTVYRVDPTSIGDKFTDIKTNILPDRIEQVVFCCDRGRSVIILREPRTRRSRWNGFLTTATQVTRTEVGVDSSDESSDESSEDEGGNTNPLSKYAIT